MQTGKERKVLFLGDMGPDAGEELLATHGDYLKSSIVQMAHHGHIGVRKDVYEAIDPNVCVWCAASWLWQDVPEDFVCPICGLDKDAFEKED